MDIQGFDEIKLTFLWLLESFVPGMYNRRSCSFCTSLYDKEGFGVYRGVRTLFSDTRERKMYNERKLRNLPVLEGMSMRDFEDLRSTLAIFLSLIKTMNMGQEGTSSAASDGGPIRDMLSAFGIIPRMPRRGSFASKGEFALATGPGASFPRSLSSASPLSTTETWAGTEKGARDCVFSFKRPKEPLREKG